MTPPVPKYAIRSKKRCACSARGWSIPNGSRASSGTVTKAALNSMRRLTIYSVMTQPPIFYDWMYENVAQTYTLNPGIRRFLTASNPWALYAMTERLLEAAQRGLWRKPADATLRALTQLHLDTEAL